MAVPSDGTEKESEEPSWHTEDPPFNGDHFINGSWKMVLGIKTFRNGSPYSGSSISKTQNPWVGIRLLTGFVDMFLGIVASWFGREE